MLLTLCVFVASLFLTLFLALLCMSAAPKNDYERRVADEEQMQYLAEYRKKKNRR